MMEPVAYVAFEADGRVKYAFKTQMDGGSPSVPLVRLSDAEARIVELERDLRIAIEQRNMTITEMQGQTDRAEAAEALLKEARDVLSGISSFLGAGLGDDNTTANQYDKRIRWGIDELQSSIIRLCMEKVERASERPATTWGEVKASLASIDTKPTAAPSGSETDKELLDEAKAALEPFVSAFNKAHSKYAARYGDSVEIGFARFDTMPDSWAMDNITFNMGDFRAARAIHHKIGVKDE